MDIWMHLCMLVLNQQIHKMNVALYSCNKGVSCPHKCGAAVARIRMDVKAAIMMGQEHELQQYCD